MAKVINPLLSGSASGQLGGMMTFDKRGFVRQYVVPSNPKTVNQMAVRDTLGDLQRELKLLGTKLRGELKSGFGYRWNSLIIGELMANDKAAYTAYLAEYTAFTGPQKADYVTADGATPIALTKGALLYACASAIYDMAARLGVTVTLAQPGAANAATIGTAFTAAA